jgi:aspartyl-tRNA(Asn)/glutamyl-tRNA(Gln) amidotransferase subunit C
MSMASLTKNDVTHVAKLAKLNLTEAEEDKFLSQLSNIVNFISDLSEVDTTNIEPTSQTTGLTNVYREDVVKPEALLTNEEALSGTDETYNGYVKVDAILSERSSK